MHIANLEAKLRNFPQRELGVRDLPEDPKARLVTSDRVASVHLVRVTSFVLRAAPEAEHDAHP